MTFDSSFLIIVQIYSQNDNITFLSHPSGDFRGNERALHLRSILVITELVR